MEKRELRFIELMAVIAIVVIMTLWYYLYNMMPTAFITALAPTYISIFECFKLLVYPFIIVSSLEYYFILDNNEKTILKNIQNSKAQHFHKNNLTDFKNYLTVKIITCIALPVFYTAIFCTLSYLFNINLIIELLSLFLSLLAGFGLSTALFSAKRTFDKFFYYALALLVLMLAALTYFSFVPQDHNIFYPLNNI
jgi:hypothetical protein